MGILLSPPFVADVFIKTFLLSLHSTEIIWSCVRGSLHWTLGRIPSLRESTVGPWNMLPGESGFGPKLVGVQGALKSYGLDLGSPVRSRGLDPGILMRPFQRKISCDSIILWFRVISRRADVIVIDYSQHDEEKQLFIAFVTFKVLTHLLQLCCLMHRGFTLCMLPCG